MAKFIKLTTVVPLHLPSSIVADIVDEIVVPVDSIFSMKYKDVKYIIVFKEDVIYNLPSKDYCEVRVTEEDYKRTKKILL